MSLKTKHAVEKTASAGCCGGKGKGKIETPAVAKPDAKPASNAKHADHKKTGGSCC